ncbi:PREDICTED: uncharacterized protein C4orf3-like [Elephantulus edwardii]|uniref:uncharacterized protein C4orf3-like n=1 Tax=Elephantulus edwardii TaxID=28737 RepID=UPI0003F0C0B4|nr:PREDICTED: uncharacterized protein C4orf3-like [Elephantulus edwardii]
MRALVAAGSEMEPGAEAVGSQDGLRERRGSTGTARREQSHSVQPYCGPNGIPRHSYWLDLWLFILFNLVLFFFMYFMP